ncbi:MAG: hypothetical protein ACUVRS_04115 [Armatimonadota bacterium]
MANTVSLLKTALSSPGLVQSFSGVRAVFGLGPGIPDELEVLAVAYGWAYFLKIVRSPTPVLIVGRDPRPTGEALARALTKGFLAGAISRGLELHVIDLGIITTPLAQTAVRALNAHGGVIVTASHNPLEHNGFKFLTGKVDVTSCKLPYVKNSCECSSGLVLPGSFESAPVGALLSASAMGEVIECVRRLAEGFDAEIFTTALERVGAEQLYEALNGHDNDSPRVKAERAYLDEIGRDWGITPHCLKPLTLGPALLDPNGGASSGVGARVLEHFGVRTIEINAELGFPEHGIDTDGIDLASGRHMLLRVARAAARHGARFGVAFDYDADRGNLVLPGTDETAIIPPQRVATFNIGFALARYRVRGGDTNKPLAVVISDSTSLASVRVAEAFGAEVHVVETGEINVVTKMHELRENGYEVPVGVEGANGGTVFGSSTCRDGLQVAMAAAIAESQPDIVSEWWRVIGRFARVGDEYVEGREPTLNLRALISSVPANPNKMLCLSAPSVSQAEFKSNIEREFAGNIWPHLNNRFESYEFENFEGTRRVVERTGDQSGAWRVVLIAPERRAFVFLRGSRTEAGIWRMIVDCEDPDDFTVLENLAREMFSRVVEKCES